MPSWLLPESIADILPSQARKIEELRRRLLDLFRRHGYELVMPPLVEYLESLLTGTGSDLDLRTFKLVDQLSGRTLGIRPDLTPQVARIDAHLLNREGVVRLCYAGSVLHATPAGPFASREPIHLGAELYGHAGVEADLEVIDLTLSALAVAGLPRVQLDLSHVGIVRALLARAPALRENEVLPLLQAKDAPSLAQVLVGTDATVRDALLALPALYGMDAQAVLAQARRRLPDWPEVVSALDELARIVGSPLLARRADQADLMVDLADLRGYGYHSGVTFAAYVAGQHASIARGGRYDRVGASFGRARPATGFSLELRELAGLQPDAPPAAAIRAPWSDAAGLVDAVACLRAEGHIVVQVLPGHEHEQQEFACDRELIEEEGSWTLRPLERT